MTDSKVLGSVRKPPSAGIGRKKGVPNKTTQAIKDAIVQAFDRAGGADYLVQLAKDDPRTFCGLVGKVIPLQVEGDLQGLVINVVNRAHDKPVA